MARKKPDFREALRILQYYGINLSKIPDSFSDQQLVEAARDQESSDFKAIVKIAGEQLCP